MTLTTGSRVGAFEVTGSLGAGGMGEVYRARDSRLQRDVALKVLPAALATDVERLARFRREAQLLASLNHPNIAAIHGLEDLDGSAGAVCIVMEFVEGEDLAQRIARGPLPFDEALPLARQVVDALQAAHDRGVVHRDLKPANIKVRPDGTVKVLDFGLAKAFDGDADSQSAGLTQTPTLSSPAMTRAGIILGTAAYMAPEQARGKSVDKRADIWAFGVVLFEMLTGTRLFGGSEVSDTLAFVLTKEPDWTALPAGTPAPIRRLLRRCLQKDRSQRLADIADARLDIDEALKEPSSGEVSAPASRPIPLWRRAAPWGVAVIALAALAAVVVLWAPGRRITAAPLIAMRSESGANVVVTSSSGVAFAPDGNAVAFAGRAPNDPVAVQVLYYRRLDRLDAQALPGTDRAVQPFFSPDGRWLAFFSDGALKKVPVDGGGVVVLCDATAPRGGWWADDNTLVFASADGLFRTTATGGRSERLSEVKPGDRSPSGPQVLPGGRGVLYFESGTSDPNNAIIAVRPLPRGEPKVLQRGGLFPRYVASGHLLFLRYNTVFAVPFDPDTLETRGGAVPVLNNAGLALLGVADAGGRGALAFTAGTGAEPTPAPVMWLDRSAAPSPLRAAPLAWGFPRFSPDGKRLALMVWDGKQGDIWVYEWERDILTRLTSDPSNDFAPVWTPDGRYIIFGSERGGGVSNVYVQRADGTSGAQRLTETAAAQLPDAVHPNGRVLVLHQGDPSNGRQSLVSVPIEVDAEGKWKGGTPTTFVGGDFLKANPRLSPDGRWVAYAANDSGRWEIYVQPFPGTGGRIQISSEGGNLALWSPTRPELLYARDGQAQMMVAPYRISGDTFTPEKAQPWSQARFSAAPPVDSFGPGFDLHPSGLRFAVAPPRATTVAASEPPSQLVFVFNLHDALRRLAPATK